MKNVKRMEQKEGIRLTFIRLTNVMELLMKKICYQKAISTLLTDSNNFENVNTNCECPWNALRMWQNTPKNKSWVDLLLSTWVFSNIQQ